MLAPAQILSAHPVPGGIFTKALAIPQLCGPSFHQVSGSGIGNENPEEASHSCFPRQPGCNKPN